MVVYVVCRSNLQTARTKLNVYVAILYDRYLAAHQRHDDMQPAEPGILHIGRVDAHGGVAHDGFRTCGSHNGIVAFLVFVYHIALVLARNLVLLHHIIFKMEEMRVLVFVYHLLVREGRLRLRIPVHHAHATINVAFLI